MTIEEFIDYYALPDKGVFPKSITCYIFTCRGGLDQAIYTKEGAESPDRRAESQGNETQPYNCIDYTELLEYTDAPKESAKIICQTDKNPVCKRRKVHKGGSRRKRKTKRNKKRTIQKV